ncbi:MAG: four helix bundle protein [Phycisphaerae bacterium]|nr:four helix bundle protein [Phycisphaerae bacterium]
MQRRTRELALRVVKLASSLPKNRTGDVFARQLVRCGTSVAANYRSACRARSHAEFLARLGLVEEEADETVFWIELAVDAGLAARPRVANLLTEGNEILAIVTASRKTAKSRSRTD